MQEHHFPVSRTARYFTLGPTAGAVRQVWFVCHGYGQSAHGFVRALRAIDDGTRLIVAPEGLSRFYTRHRSRRVGASWMTREDRLAEIADYVTYLDRLAAHVLQRSGRVHVAVRVLGFSQGAATAARWVSLGSTIADRLILWGGLVPPDLDLEMAWVKLEDSRLTLVMGDHDARVDRAELHTLEARLLQFEIPYEVLRYDGGHRLDEDLLRRLAAS